jgi:beta-glucanase (GH16 family)
MVEARLDEVPLPGPGSEWGMSEGRPVWADEFDGPPGSPPDPAVWVPEVGGGGWGDDQLQHYTASPANAFVTGDGQLAVVARREAGVVTSARLITHHRLHVRHGRVEARVKVPAGPGVWPAFWMLGTDIDRVGWPACGEIDVMEHVGSEPSTVHGTAHGPGYAGVGRGIGRAHDTGAALADDFHVYGVRWADEQISWYVDGVEYHRLTPDDVPGPWPYRGFFYLLLNLAVGGRWPGNSADGLTLPATMLVDWVRVHDAEIER